MANKKPEKQTGKNQSVEKLFSIIETMAQSSTAMRLQDIAESIEMHPSTVSRFLNTLMGLGYVYQDSLNHRYCLTLKLTHIGYQIASRISIRDIARPYLIDLSSKCEEAVCLATEQNMNIIYLDVVDNNSYHLCFIQQPGACAPMHCTGIGKLLLANKSDTELKHYFKVKRPDYFTNNTIATLSELRNQLDTIRIQGYSVDNEEYTEGVRSIAAPIKDYSGKTLYGISIAGPSARLHHEKIRKVAPMIMDMAKEISNVFGTIE